MDETTEKKVRALKLKLLMAEKELHASSGKWKLGALLGAGHASAMNREVIKLKERLEGKIEKLRQELALLTGEPLPATTAQEKPVHAPVKKAVTEVEKPAPAKKTTEKKVAVPAVKKSSAKTPTEPVKKAEKKSAPAKSASKKAPAKKSGKK